jgi:hypothetical protein
MSSSVADMQAKASSQTGVDWVPVYHNTFPRSSRSNAHSKPPSGGKIPILSSVREHLSG